MVQNQKNCGKQAQAKGLFDRLLGGGWQIPFDCRSDTSKVTPLPQGDWHHPGETRGGAHHQGGCLGLEGKSVFQLTLLQTPLKKGIQGFEKMCCHPAKDPL